MITSYTFVLSELYPGTQWSISNEDYDTLQWHSVDVEKPTKETLDARYQEAIEHKQSREQQQYRESLTCSRFQAIAVLHQMDLLETIKQIVETAEDPMLKIAWDNAVEFRRTSTFIISLVTLLGLTEEQLDHMFETAKKIFI